MEPSHLPCSSLTHPAAILTPSIGVLRWIRAYPPVQISGATSRKRYLILLGLGLAFAAFLLWMIPSCLAAKGQAEEVVRGVFEATAAGDADLAVEFHSPRTGYTLELADLIRAGEYDESLRGYEGISFNKSVEFSKSTGGDTISISGDMYFRGRPSIPLFVELIKEDGIWKIVGFRTGDQ